MLKKITIIHIILFNIIFAFSDNFQEGNIEFSNKNYNNAKKEYLEEINTNGYELNTLLNLANTNIKLEEYGEALYYFYKARSISPRDPHIKQKIKEIEEILELQGQYKILFPLSYDENWNLTLFLSLFITLTIFILIILNRQDKKQSLLFRLKKIILLTLSLFFLISSLGNFFNNSNKNFGIVLQKDEVKISPYEGSESTFVANEGLKVKISEYFEDFVYVTDNDGRYGWIKKDLIGEIWEY